MNPIVSIIIPVYNVEAYIEECLNSVIQQTEKNLEIIVINDGSTDNSLDVVKKVAATDQRIKVLEQENQGLSITRNNGIEIANGEFIMFLDSDDFLDIHCVKKCLVIATKNDLSVISFDAETFNETDSSFTPDYDRQYKMPTLVMNGTDFLITEKKKVGRINNSSAMKFIKLELLKNENIRFKPYILQEDILFNYQIMLASERVCYAPYAFYKRRIREGSIMTSTFKMKNLLSYQVTLNELANILCVSNRLERLYFAQLFDIFGFALKHVLKAKNDKSKMREKLIEIYHQIPSLKLKIYLIIELLFRGFTRKNPRQIMFKVR